MNLLKLNMKSKIIMEIWVFDSFVCFRQHFNCFAKTVLMYPYYFPVNRDCASVINLSIVYIILPQVHVGEINGTVSGDIEW